MTLAWHSTYLPTYLPTYRLTHPPWSLSSHPYAWNSFAFFLSPQYSTVGDYAATTMSTGTLMLHTKVSSLVWNITHSYHHTRNPIFYLNINTSCNEQNMKYIHFNGWPTCPKDKSIHTCHSCELSLNVEKPIYCDALAWTRYSNEHRWLPTEVAAWILRLFWNNYITIWYRLRVNNISESETKWNSSLVNTTVV